MSKVPPCSPGTGPSTGLDIEVIANELGVKVHEAWMRQRQREGWVYGRQRNDPLKQHPNLVGYELLTEAERAIDKEVASSCIQGLLESGYRIKPPGQNAKTDAPDPFASAIQQRLAFRSQLSMDALHSLSVQCRALPDCPSNIYLGLGEEILRRGEPLQAYDVLSEGLAKFEGRSDQSQEEAEMLLRLTQLSALALAQSGASDRAARLLVQLRERGDRTPETLGMLGRVYKDLAGRCHSKKERDEKLRQALKCYQEGFESSQAMYRESGNLKCGEEAYYCGINVAAVHLLLAERAPAMAVAKRVREICGNLLGEAEKHFEHGHYWLLATMGEAELVCGKFESAKKWYSAAVKSAKGNWRELSSTRQQLRLLVKCLGLPAKLWERLFPKATVVVFASPNWRATSALPLGSWETKFRQELDRRMTKLGVVAGYLGAASPVDILFGEALLRHGAEVRLVLPYPREICKQALVAHAPWQARFDALLSRAASITDDTKRGSIDDTVNLEFAALRALGSAKLRARRLGMDLHCWGVEAIAGVSSPEEPAFLLEHWQTTNTPWQPIALKPTKTKPRRTARVRRKVRSTSVETDSYRVLSMLFADVRGYSKLDDTALLRFSHYFTREISLILKEFEDRLLLSRTAGDGLFLVFSEIEAAADAAQLVRDRIAQTSWPELDLPDHLGIRISLDAGPVYTFQDPVVRSMEVCGEFVIRAARIEPITPPNEVYASEAFTSLYVAAGGSRFRFDYVGQTQLPKGFGWTALYSVTRP